MIISKKKFQEVIKEELNKQQAGFDRLTAEREREIWMQRERDDTNRYMHEALGDIGRRLGVLEQRLGINRERDDCVTRPARY